jgi:hypothetical protein
LPDDRGPDRVRKPTWFWLGRADYRRVLADQLALRERVWSGHPGAV